jgi:release factor glutamine methyltransferase
MENTLTIKEALDKSADYLRKKGSSSARLDAEVLLSFILKLARLQLYLQFDRPLSEEEITRYRELLKRRGEHEPVAYITGEKEFMSLPFFVNRSVLIPRPDTEVLVEQSIKRIREWIDAHSGAMPCVFELGTGSGAISICLLLRFPELRILAGDISREALETARRNAERHGVESRLTLMEGDLFCGLEGPFDFIISNPPYIAEKDKNALSPDIILHEPHKALFAGPEGLDVLIRIIREGKKIISHPGWILVEIGKDQYIKLLQIVGEPEKFQSVQVVEDYAGLVRVLCMMK